MSPVRRALLSVFDKQGLVEFASRLASTGVELIASGGTAEALESAGLPVTTVEAVTGAPEMLGGRVKTLHPAIHGAILADTGRADHLADLEDRGIRPIELVVCNLYPFEAAAASGAPLSEVVEQIDIGGVALIRAAAKNHRSVGVVVSPDQYDEVAEAVAAGGIDGDLRIRLAGRAFARTAAYDAAIAAQMGGSGLADRLSLSATRERTLRYGENPHQAAAAYRLEGGWWTAGRLLQGKEPSYNNLADADAAWRLVNRLRQPAAVVVKHTNPAGAAEATSAVAATAGAWAGDSMASFGGVVAVAGTIDLPTASFILEKFVEVVIASDVDRDAADALATKPNLRVIAAPPPGEGDLDMRRIDGGLLVQERDTVHADPTAWKLAAGPAPSEEMVVDLRLAWVVAAGTHSNAVVLARGRSAVGVGAGDQSRVGAAKRALAVAGERSQGAVAASDGFLPFRDGLDVLADAGVAAVVEPGGSRRDDEVIAAAEEHGITLLFTGRRHFRH